MLLTLLKLNASNLSNSSIYYEKYHGPQVSNFPGNSSLDAKIIVNQRYNTGKEPTHVF